MKKIFLVLLLVLLTPNKGFSWQLLKDFDPEKGLLDHLVNRPSDIFSIGIVSEKYEKADDGKGTSAISKNLNKIKMSEQDKTALTKSVKESLQQWFSVVKDHYYILPPGTTLYNYLAQKGDFTIDVVSITDDDLAEKNKKLAAVDLIVVVNDVSSSSGGFSKDGHISNGEELVLKTSKTEEPYAADIPVIELKTSDILVPNCTKLILTHELGHSFGLADDLSLAPVLITGDVSVDPNSVIGSSVNPTATNNDAGNKSKTSMDAIFLANNMMDQMSGFDGSSSQNTYKSDFSYFFSIMGFNDYAMQISEKNMCNSTISKEVMKLTCDDITGIVMSIVKTSGSMDSFTLPSLCKNETGTYKGGKQVGKWTIKYPKGQTLFEGEYDASGRREDYKTYYADGTLLMEKGVDKDGTAYNKSYYKSGRTRSSTAVKGSLTTEEFFRNDEKSTPFSRELNLKDGSFSCKIIYKESGNPYYEQFEWYNPSMVSGTFMYDASGAIEKGFLNYYDGTGSTLIDFLLNKQDAYTGMESAQEGIKSYFKELSARIKDSKDASLLVENNEGDTAIDKLRSKNAEKLEQDIKAGYGRHQSFRDYKSIDMEALTSEEVKDILTTDDTYSMKLNLPDGEMSVLTDSYGVKKIRLSMSYYKDWTKYDQDSAWAFIEDIKKADTGASCHIIDNNDYVKITDLTKEMLEGKSVLIESFKLSEHKDGPVWRMIKDTGKKGVMISGPYYGYDGSFDCDIDEAMAVFNDVKKTAKKEHLVMSCDVQTFNYGSAARMYQDDLEERVTAGCSVFGTLPDKDSKSISKDLTRPDATFFYQDGNLRGVVSGLYLGIDGNAYALDTNAYGIKSKEEILSSFMDTNNVKVQDLTPPVPLPKN